MRHGNLNNLYGSKICDIDLISLRIISAQNGSLFMTQKFEALVGLCVVAMASIFIFILLQMNKVGLTNDFYPVTAYFSNISGVSVGTDIKMSGVKIGSVQNADLDIENYRAKLTMAIQKNVKLPTDSVAKIASESLLGGSSIQIEPGFEEAFIQPNQEIVNTQSSVNIMDMIAKAVFSAGASDTDE